MTEMKTLTIDDKTYEVVDAKAREDVSKLSGDIPTVDDISDMGFVLKDAISYMEDEISALKAQGVQQVPLFANSTKECTDTTKMYVLPDGYVYAYLPEPAYTNILDTVGYQENMRISVSSGYKEKENEGSDLTGYIPFKANDIIRLKNITLPILETGYGAVMYTYNSSREGVSSVQLGSSYANNGYNRAVYDDAGNLIQFTLHEFYYNETYDNAEGYIRINAADINKASIITVNEEITDDTTTYAWKNTGHAFVPADYEDWIVELEEITSENKENIENVTKRISALESSQSDAQLPDYCVMHLEEKIALIRQAMEGAGRDKSSFLYYTDAHWTYNSQMSPALLKYLHQNTPINKIIYGGDIVDNESDVRSDMSYLYEWRAAIRGLPNHHSVKGNHDDGNVTDKRFDEKYIYAFLMAAEESSDIVRGGDFYYYIDDVCEKTRYLYLDTGYFSVGDDQVQFFVNALNDTPDGWHIVAIAHVWFLYADTATPTVGSVPEYCQKLLSLFDAYNNRNNGSVTMNSSAISYDFTDASGKVAFCVGGHTHADMDFTSDGGIPVIITETDSKHVRSGLTCTEGTITEFSVNAIIADYDANEIHVIRIGRGEDRTVSMTN